MKNQEPSDVIRPKTSFEDWFYETEVFSLRAERFWDDLESFQNGDLDSSRIEAWLRAAFNVANGVEDDDVG